MAKTDSNSVHRKRAVPSKRGAQTRRIGWLLALLFAAVVIIDGIVGDRGLLAMLRARRQYDELSVSLERQKAENAKLRDEARRLREDPRAIEELARRELGLMKPGEKVFIVKDLKK